MRFFALATITAAALALAAPAQACPTHDIALPAEAGKGQPREVKELLDTPFVKLVTITLRGGTKLTKHSAKEAVTIQALSGTGELKLEKGTDKLGPGNVVLVAPGAEHEIVPSGTGDLVLLLHFLKAANGVAADGHDAHHAHGEPAKGKKAAGHDHH